MGDVLWCSKCEARYLRPIASAGAAVLFYCPTCDPTEEDMARAARRREMKERTEALAKQVRDLERDKWMATERNRIADAMEAWAKEHKVAAWNSWADGCLDDLAAKVRAGAFKEG